jgi:two-component SAPR family response regulator
MPDFTGFDFIQTINLPKVILVTSDKNFAIEAFEYECIVDYLVKPIDRFKSDSKVNSLHLSALSIEAKPKGDSNQKISILTLIADSSRFCICKYRRSKEITSI